MTEECDTGNFPELDLECPVRHRPATEAPIEYHPSMRVPPHQLHAPGTYPALGPIIDRLREVYGPEASVGPFMLRWWVKGMVEGLGVAVMIDTTPHAVDEPCVIWVTRPGESKPERCPIVTMEHLDAFLVLVTAACRSDAPVHGHVCPGED